MEGFVSQVNQTDLKTQVVSEVQRYIKAMDLSVNNKLPREEDFCKILGVSRITLRSVLDKLEHEGVIFRKRGKGTFVNVHSVNLTARFAPAEEIMSVIKKSGYTPTVRLINVQKITAGQSIGELLSIAPEDQVLVIEKAYYADQKFCVYIQDYVNLNYLPETQLPKDAYETPVFQMLLDQFQIKITWDKVEIGACQSREIPFIQQAIEAGTYTEKALLVLKGINYDENNRPILLGCEYVDTDMIHFSQIRVRSE